MTQSDRPLVSRSSFRIDGIVCGILGFAAIIGVGWLVYAVRDARAVANSNAIVEWKVREATALLESGKIDEALSLADEAAHAPRATNTSEALELKRKLVIQRDKAVARDKLVLARSLFCEGKFDQARSELEQYEKLPQQEEKEYARQLLAASRHVSTNENVVQYLCELTDKDFDMVSNGRLPVSAGRLRDPSGVVVLERLQSNLEGDRAKRHRNAEFRKCVYMRAFESPESRGLFEGYFSALMKTLDEESVTPAHRREYKEVRQILDTQGYRAFAVNYMAILEEIYTVDNYTTDRESEVKRRLESRRNEVFKNILDAVVAAIPCR